MCKILERITIEQSTTCDSSEEMIAEIERINREGLDDDFILGSADVKALYPSLDIPFTIEIVSKMFLDSGVIIENVDYEELGIYISLNKTEQEIKNMSMESWCPKKKNRRGPPLKMTGNGVENDRVKRYKPWTKGIIPENEDEKKRMMSEAIKIALRTIMTNHTYLYDGVIRKQEKGGPIGMKLTGTLAKVFMSWWSKQYIEKVEALGMTQRLYKCYVDDINLGMRCSTLGARFDENRITISVESQREDEEKMKDERTMDLIKQVGNSIHPSIKLEVEYPSKYVDNKMPILDMKVWIEENSGKRIIFYEFYRKEVSSKMTLHANSAISLRTKRVILTQEVLRILRHCSKELPWNKVTDHINEMVKRMQFSGYKKEFRYQVVKSAINAYQIMLDEEINGVRPMHRPKEWQKHQRAREREGKSKNWLKGTKFESLIFIPATRNSELQKEMQKKVNNSGIRIKIIERTGTSLKSKLQRSNPFRKMKCGRIDCFLCTTDGKGDCNRSNIKYSIVCLGDGEACSGVYHGETAENAYTRGKEHLQEIRAGKSRFNKHCAAKHNKVLQPLRMHLDKSYQGDALKRQIIEGVYIQRTDNENRINDRAEWNHPRISRIGNG